MDETYRGYPGFEQRQINSELERHLENLEILGYSVMEGVLPRNKAAEVEERLGQLWKKQEEEFGKERLLQLGEHGTHRGLLIEDEIFVDMVIEPKVLEVIHALVGQTAILNLQNASAAFPHVKHFQSAFHRDFAKDFVATKPLSVNAFWCISEFTADNGATEVVPYTHRVPTLPSSKFIASNSRQVIAPAGAVIFWDSLLLHKAGHNRTEKTRFGINHMYTRPFLKQQVDFPVFLKDRVDIESKLGQILGFWTIPPKSIKEFRVDKEKRTYRGGQG